MWPGDCTLQALWVLLHLKRLTAMTEANESTVDCRIKG